MLTRVRETCRFKGWMDGETRQVSGAEGAVAMFIEQWSFVGGCSSVLLSEG